jgi:hypothetical protein
MVNNFPNINKMKNHLSPQTTEQKKRHRHMMILEIQAPFWDRCKNVAGLKPLLGTPHPLA